MSPCSLPQQHTLLKEALTDVSRKQETRVVLLLHPECTCWQQSTIQVYVTWHVQTLINCVATFSQVNNPSGLHYSRINRVNASESDTIVEWYRVSRRKT